MSEYYVIQVYTGSEQKTIENIKNNIPKEIISDCFFVVKRRKKKYQGTWHLVEENCFPGYVFIETDDPKEMCRRLSMLHVFARVLGMNKETFYVQPIAKEERFFIDSITNRNTNERTIELSNITIEEGQAVSIVSGPLKGFEGRVKKYDFHKRKAIIEVNLLGSLVRTDLGIEIIKKID